MQNRYRVAFGGALVLMLACVGCVTIVPGTSQDAAPVTTEKSIAAKPAILSLETGALQGVVTAPVIAVGGGNVIATGGGNVIATGGGNVIAVGGGNVIATGGGNYRINQAADDRELPVVGAVVVLRDPVTLKAVNWVPPMTTDESGAFRFEKLPKKINYLVEVVFVTKDQKPFRLLKLAKAADQAAPQTEVTWASTAVATTMIEQAQKVPAQSSGMYVAETGKLLEAEAEMKRAMNELKPEERVDQLSRALEMPESEVKSENGVTVIELRSVLPPTAIEAPARMVTEVASDLEVAKDTMETAPTLEDARVISAATQVIVAEEAPTLDGTRIEVKIEPTPSPAPTLAIAPIATKSIAPSLEPLPIIRPTPTPTPIPVVIRTIEPSIEPIISPIIRPTPTPTPTPIAIKTIAPIIKPTPTPTPIPIKTISPIIRR